MQLIHHPEGFTYIIIGKKPYTDIHSDLLKVIIALLRNYETLEVQEVSNGTTVYYLDSREVDRLVTSLLGCKFH